MLDLATDPMTEEVRVAMALNGGVSLAVWMGGCGVELDAARRAHVEGSSRPVYAALCRAFARVLVLDVMSGASAGGINGALLAAAIVNRRRLEPDFVRNRWLKLGDFSKLLQPAAKGDPASLLQGTWFRSQLEETFKELINDDAWRDDDAPDTPGDVLLDVTTTDVAGQPVRFRDFWGQWLEANEYRARFRFREPRQYSFDRLAGAARSSASFPVAFEPNEVDGELAGLPGTRWMLDGGLLDNAPISAAIDLIPGRNAARQVRRFVCYVNAEPASLVAREPGMPTLAQIAGDVVSLPRKAPFVDQLRAVEDATRRSLLTDHEPELALLTLDLEVLEAVASVLLPAYCIRRSLESLDELVGQPGVVTERVRETPDIPLPWIPASLAALDDGRWQWGLRPAQRVIHLLIGALRRAVPDASPDHRRALLKARQAVGAEYAKLDSHRANVGEAGDRLMAALAEVRRVDPMPMMQAAFECALGVRGLLLEADRAFVFGSFDVFLRRALALEVILRAHGRAPDIDSGQELRFVQLTPEAPTPLLQRQPWKPVEPPTPRDKLLGVRLGHFGGFYRGSWRVNDFMWGRLDAAARIVEMLVAPGRVKQIHDENWIDGAPWELLAGALAEAAGELQTKLLEEALADLPRGYPRGDGSLRARLSRALEYDLLEAPEPKGRLTRMVCMRAAQLEVFLDEWGPLWDASSQDAKLGGGMPALEFSQPEDALENLRDGAKMPDLLAAPDEAVSTLALRTSAHAGLVALAALRTAKVPLARFLFGLRALLLPVSGSVANVWWLRAGVALTFWASALVLASRIVQTNPDKTELAVDGDWAAYLALAVVAVLVVAGTLLVPLARMLRGTRGRAVEGAKVLALAVTGGAGAALIAWWVGGVSWAQLVGAPDATYPRWVAATVLAVVIGAPVTVVPALLRGYLGDLIEKPWAGKWMLIVFAVVAGLAGGAAIWAMRNQLTGETWQVLAGWLAIAGPPVAAFFCLRLWAWTVVVASAALAPDRLGDLGPAANAELPE